MKKITNFALILMILSPAIAGATEKMQVAVLDFKTRAISTTLGKTVPDLLRAEMVKTGYFIVVERSQMDQILKEQGFQQTGCTDSACAVELGKLLSAKKILLGEVSRLGSSIVITVRIVDIEKGIAEFAESENAENENKIYDACKNLTNRLTENIIDGNSNGFQSSAGRKQKFQKTYELYEAASKSQLIGCCVGSFIPGGQHFYAGYYLTGFAYLSASFSALTFYSIYSDKSDAGSTASQSDKDKYKRRAGYSMSAYFLIRVADIIHGVFAIRNHNKELLKKIDSLSLLDEAEFNFDYAYNPEIFDNQLRAGLTLRF